MPARLETLDLILAASPATPPLCEWSANTDGDMILARTGEGEGGKNRFGIYPLAHDFDARFMGIIGRDERTGAPDLVWKNWGNVYRRLQPDNSFTFDIAKEPALRVTWKPTSQGIRVVFQQLPDSPYNGSILIVPCVAKVTQVTPRYCRGFQLPFDRLPVYTG